MKDLIGLNTVDGRKTALVDQVVNRRAKITLAFSLQAEYRGRIGALVTAVGLAKVTAFFL